MSKVRSILLMACLFANGCATVDPALDYDLTAERIRASTGSTHVYDPRDDALVAAHIENLLEDGISPSEAVDICLLNNPDLQALFYDIGLKRADVVQSQLLSNPTIGIAARFPDGGGLLNIEGSLAQNLVDLWQLPLRKSVAEYALERTILEVAQAAARLAAEAKAAYARSRAASQLVEISGENREAAQRLVAISESLRDAGAGSGVDVNLVTGALQESELALQRARLEAVEALTELVRVLGLAVLPSTLVLTEDALAAPREIASMEDLLETAVTHRMDLAAAGMELRSLAGALKIEQNLVFKVVRVGVQFERESRPSSHDGNYFGKTVRSSIAAGALSFAPLFGENDDEAGVIVGPSLSVELPLFDQNQAQIAKAEFAYRAAAKRVQSLLLDVSRDVRLAYQRAKTAWDITRYYESQVLPLQERSLALAQDAYRAGKVPVLSVLASQRSLQGARAGHIRARLKSALAWIDVERVTARPGGHLSPNPQNEHTESDD